MSLLEPSWASVKAFINQDITEQNRYLGTTRLEQRRRCSLGGISKWIVTWSIASVPDGQLHTKVISHVLKHYLDPADGAWSYELWIKLGCGHLMNNCWSLWYQSSGSFCSPWRKARKKRTIHWKTLPDVDHKKHSGFSESLGKWGLLRLLCNCWASVMSRVLFWAPTKGTWEILLLIRACHQGGKMNIEQILKSYKMMHVR